MKYFLILAALLLTSVTFSEPIPQTSAYNAIVADIENNRDAYLNGVFIYNIPDKDPQLMVLSRVPYNEWRKGIDSYGCQYTKSEIVVLKTYDKSLPRGLKQDKYKTFRDSSGRAYVPGIKSITSSKLRSWAQTKLNALDTEMNARAKASSTYLVEATKFVSLLEDKSNTGAASAALSQDNWAGKNLVLTGSYQLLAQNKQAIGFDIDSFVMGCLSDDNMVVRESAAMCAVVLRNPKFKSKLVALLDDKNARTRYFAIGALVNQRDKSVLAKVSQMATTDQSKMVRQWSGIAAQYLKYGLDLKGTEK